MEGTAFEKLKCGHCHFSGFCYTGKRPRGSALDLFHCKRGNPCSGVRGHHEVPTDGSFCCGSFAGKLNAFEAAAGYFGRREK